MAAEAVRTAYDKGYRVQENGLVLSPRGRARALGTSTTGYLRFNIGFRGTAFPVYVHRLAAYQRFGGQIFGPNTHVRHLNNDPKDNRRTNIGIGSPHDNAMDRPAEERLAHATHAAQSSPHKYSDDVIRQIRADHSKGLSYRQLGVKYGVSKSTLSFMFNSARY